MGGSGGLVDCGIAVCCCKLDGEGATILTLTGCCPGVCASPGVLGPPLPTDLGPAGEGATVVTAAAGLAPVGGWLTGEPFEGGVGLKGKGHIQLRAILEHVHSLLQCLRQAPWSPSSFPSDRN